MKYKTVTEYIETQPENNQKILRELRILLKKAYPKGVESISYNVPALSLKDDGKRDSQVMYAGFKKHIGFYPFPTTIEHFKKELIDYKTAKGSIQFPVDKPLPKKLITKMVKFRVKELQKSNSDKRSTTSKVDIFIKNSKRWKQEIEALRNILLKTKLEEEFKWSKPCYSFEGSNIAIIQPFKSCLGFMFFKGSLLKDPKKLLVDNGPNSQAARRLEFESLSEINKQAPILRAYIKEAISIAISGDKVKFKKKPEPMPKEMKDYFKKKPKVKKAFEALTPGRQRGYILHVSSAKQSATRQSRIEKCTDKILSGKGISDR